MFYTYSHAHPADRRAPASPPGRWPPGWTTWDTTSRPRSPIRCAWPASPATSARCTASPISGRRPWSGSITCSTWPRSRTIDVIFPTQEQVTVLSHQLPRLAAAGLATAVPPFASLAQVQDKLSALRTLDRAGGPPAAHDRRAGPVGGDRLERFPAYVKAPVGTGSAGVRRVTDATGLAEAVRHFVAAGALDGRGRPGAGGAHGHFRHGAVRLRRADRSSPSTPTSVCRKGPTAARRPSPAWTLPACAPIWCAWVRRSTGTAPCRSTPSSSMPGPTSSTSTRAWSSRATPWPRGPTWSPRCSPWPWARGRHRSTLPGRRAHPPVPHGAPGRRPAHRTAPERAGRDRPAASDGGGVYADSTEELLPWQGDRRTVDPPAWPPPWPR